MDETAIRQEIGALRPLLLRFARIQLQDEAAAEDAVQETLLVAITNDDRFEGRAALRTWLTSILKNKIVDHIRRAAREQGRTITLEDGPGGDGDGDFDALFAPDGHWRELPADWGDPYRALERNRFYDVFEACLELLPPQTARVFLMREMLGLDTNEICKELAISSANCWVVLYRARMRLRECLQTNWFGTDSGGRYTT
jgi:RNA polymerase sigma-70 factor (ECF subfamily)